MAASMASSAFAGQQVFRSTASPTRQQHRRLHVCCAAQERREGPGAIQQLALGLAAVALVHTAPANAGVVLQKSQTKKLFQSEPVERVKKESVKVGQKAKDAAPSLPSAPSINLPSVGFNTSLLTLPLAIGGIGVGTLLWKQIDPGFSAFFDDALAKNNNKIGAGYEVAIGSGQNMRGGSRSSSRAPAKKGKGSGTKKVGGGGFFGKKK